MDTLKQWIETSARDDEASCFFCGNIGVVYLGVKPSAMISVTEEKLHQCILLRKHLDFRVLSKEDGKYKIFVFHRKRLEETISKKNILHHLYRLGYEKKFKLDDYVLTLIGRLRSSEEFPHEIGFFLGYPVKDVLSFMGFLDLPLAKTMGWRMYGKTETSEQLYYQVKRTKAEIIQYAKQTQKRVC